VSAAEARLAPAVVPAAVPAVSMRHIDKRFGSVHANRDVALTVRAGTVHGIVGENGAGKSTLMSVLYGLHAADAGTIEVEGRPAHIVGARAAIALGIGMVHQHFMLVDTLSALDNVMLGAEPNWRLGPARAAVKLKVNNTKINYCNWLTKTTMLSIKLLMVLECQKELKKKNN